MEDDSIAYLLQSMHHDKSSMISEFSYLGGRSYLGSLDGGQTCYFMESLVICTYVENGQSMYSPVE